MRLSENDFSYLICRCYQFQGDMGAEGKPGSPGIKGDTVSH